MSLINSETKRQCYLAYHSTAGILRAMALYSELDRINGNEGEKRHE